MKRNLFLMILVLMVMMMASCAGKKEGAMTVKQYLGLEIWQEMQNGMDSLKKLDEFGDKEKVFDQVKAAETSFKKVEKELKKIAKNEADKQVQELNKMQLEVCRVYLEVSRSILKKKDMQLAEGYKKADQKFTAFLQKASELSK